MLRETLPLRLRQLRKEKNLTTIDVGKIIGKSDRTISAWENGRGQPDADTLLELCKIYGISSISELVGENATVLSDDEMQLIAAYRNISTQGKKYLWETLEMVKNRYKKICSDIPDMGTDSKGD